MIYQKILSLVTAVVFAASPLQSGSIISPLAPDQEQHILAVHEMPLGDRYPNPIVNNVFKDNILLTMSYYSGQTKQGGAVNWDNVRKPFTYDLMLKPGEVFAFHNNVLSQYTGKDITTTAVHFGGSDGFRSDGYLYGDGVCHLASLINWAARDAGLNVVSPTNHNFANIPDVPKQYGVAIFTDGTNDTTSEMQNLYIKNNKEAPVHFVFNYDGNTLKVAVIEE